MSLSSYHVIQLKKNPPKNTVHTYDGIAIVRSAASQKTWGDLLRLILKCFTPNRVHSLSKVHIVFDYYTDNQTFSIKQTKRVSQVADKGKWLQLEMTLKNAIRQRLQRFFKEKRLHLAYTMFVLTGCDTVSYFYRKSKKAILELVLSKKSQQLSFYQI